MFAEQNGRQPLDELEAALSQLQPVSTSVDRDRLMFAAGEAAGRARVVRPFSTRWGLLASWLVVAAAGVFCGRFLAEPRQVELTMPPVEHSAPVANAGHEAALSPDTVSPDAASPDATASSDKGMRRLPSPAPTFVLASTGRNGKTASSAPVADHWLSGTLRKLAIGLGAQHADIESISGNSRPVEHLSNAWPSYLQARNKVVAAGIETLPALADGEPTADASRSSIFDLQKRYFQEPAGG